jgi:murein endopeptidase
VGVVIALAVVLAFVIGGPAVVAQAPAPEPDPDPTPTPAATPTPTPAEAPPVAWRSSRANGRPWRGRLRDGVLLPDWGRDHFTWDPIRHLYPNRPWRRWGTDTLVRTLLDVAAAYRAEHPEAPRLGIADLSRPRGGPFGKRFGGLGHASHQNGLDADVYYPRLDRAERKPWLPRQVDRVLAQDLVDRFVAAGAEFVFVGPRLGLTGPRRVVQPLRYHDDHLHVRLRRPR